MTMYLPNLTDIELVTHATATVNELTSTPLELELTKRLEQYTDALQDFALNDVTDLRASLERFDDARKSVENLTQLFCLE